MKNLGYGSEYEYPHDATEGYVAGIQYLPDECREASFYVPSERGYEKNISERLAILKAREKGKE
jgi:putative ATPase